MYVWLAGSSTTASAPAAAAATATPTPPTPPPESSRRKSERKQRITVKPDFYSPSDYENPFKKVIAPNCNIIMICNTV